MLPHRTLLSVLVVLQGLQYSLGKSKTEILTSSNCPFTTYHMEGDDTLRVQWNGDAIDCKLMIYGPIDYQIISHVCFKVTSFHLPSCDTELNLYDKNRGSVAAKSYECDDNPEGSSICLESTLCRLGIDSGADPDATIIVDVYLKLEDRSDNDYSFDMMPMIIGVSVSGIILIATIILCFVHLRRRALQQHAQSGGTFNSTPMFTYQAQSAPQAVNTAPQVPAQTTGGYVYPTTVIQPQQ